MPKKRRGWLARPSKGWIIERVMHGKWSFKWEMVTPNGKWRLPTMCKRGWPTKKGDHAGHPSKQLSTKKNTDCHIHEMISCSNRLYSELYLSHSILQYSYNDVNILKDAFGVLQSYTHQFQSRNSENHVVYWNRSSSCALAWPTAQCTQIRNNYNIMHAIKNCITATYFQVTKQKLDGTDFLVAQPI